jgi:hypothetical protein
MPLPPITLMRSGCEVLEASCGCAQQSSATTPSHLILASTASPACDAAHRTIAARSPNTHLGHG